LISTSSAFSAEKQMALRSPKLSPWPSNLLNLSLAVTTATRAPLPAKAASTVPDLSNAGCEG